ncbi:transmembrane protein 72 [Betta splendens]|uniref:Transmembrane protein 72 n=1 Tax=Betta splendens TaxID=158456 RepID=A0A6P7KJ90_BETSP|nr:transmembrane protein 72 [Betta splendens]
MGNSESVWWTVVESACRILGVSTAIVLCAVGVETLHHGEFSSLAVYLLVSSVCIMMFELAYFVDALLIVCLPCPPDWKLFVLWGKLAAIGGFHKFLYYSIMSVVCFLHPVLVWHAIIPGIMLLVTAVFNFILSKKKKAKCPRGAAENYSDQRLTTVCATERTASGSALSFVHVMTGRRGGVIAPPTPDLCIGLGDRSESVQAMLDPEQVEAAKEAGRQRTARRERRLIWFRRGEKPVERELEELDAYCDQDADATSDTVPMITD